jgi:8-oxo-dGTP pyrophosphatase MutT (NUDIX family)
MAVAREVKEESGIDIDRTSVRCLLLFPVSVSICFICIFLCVRIFVLLLLAKNSLCAGYRAHELCR